MTPHHVHHSLPPVSGDPWPICEQTEQWDTDSGGVHSCSCGEIGTVFLLCWQWYQWNSVQKVSPVVLSFLLHAWYVTILRLSSVFTKHWKNRASVSVVRKLRMMLHNCTWCLQLNAIENATTLNDKMYSPVGKEDSDYIEFGADSLVGQNALCLSTLNCSVL